MTYTSLKAHEMKARGSDLGPLLPVQPRREILRFSVIADFPVQQQDVPMHETFQNWELFPIVVLQGGGYIHVNEINLGVVNDRGLFQNFFRCNSLMIPPLPKRAKKDIEK